MGQNFKTMVFDTPKMPFRELPKIPECFCQYPLMFAMTYDMMKAEWVWRLDMEVIVGGVNGHLMIPMPRDEQGHALPFTPEFLHDAFKVFAKNLDAWIKHGKPIK